MCDELRGSELVAVMTVSFPDAGNVEAIGIDTEGAVVFTVDDLESEIEPVKEYSGVCSVSAVTVVVAVVTT
ncbi:hypothetical protein OGATHE_000972 [Ogataea polymorpha]|uniref:Uncharacterized protein n=1 Tax=Ogataea polymorpha TaxID=460523 RepID=A0A9P8PSG3_9ASCO|nr:hypothetical protein OGATHE_000972 [Ogataea polymorpha]